MTHKRNTQGLKPIHSKWKSTNKTKAIRVPENLAEDTEQPAESLELSKVKEILDEALALKANAGNKIKDKIREALEVIELL
ncbi:hypothetical protein [Roseofilum sp. Guam]|uniref:hypothetical protein n=1 Tax=Roseofilum sp. Guam TaxID=2821502 RepID=UPI001B027743|nr:hypothetical protein [Roseofilum sp. Guam]MBP0031525.1 hypothetical protein [Roseofilum sp. Guam]